MGKTAVVYLARKGNPAHWSQGFLDTMAANPAGSDHDLVVILKGYGAGESDPAFAAHRGAEYAELRVDDTLFPIGVFFKTAAVLDGYERLLFLNSQSRGLAPNWLAKFNNAFEAIVDCGVVGATGSHEAGPGAPYPNPHLRTTGFMISRALFLSLDPGPQVTKRDGNAFEGGANGMTRQILQRGLIPIVVDRDGKPWRAEDWPASRTFRSGAQEGLLIADNRTGHYARSGLGKRRKLAALAFGDRAEVVGSSLLARWRASRRFY